MRAFIKALTAGIFLLIISPAQAIIVDFINLTEMPGGYGEGGFNPLTITNGTTTLWATGHATNDDDNTQYAYLDWGRAGLGSCKDLVSPAMANTAHPGNKANNCNPDHDDNVNANEFLQFVFNKHVLVTNIWFNNNHDGGLVAGDQVTIGSSQYNVATGYAGGANGIGSFSLNAFSPLNVAYFNKQFYVSALEYVDVPEPSSVFIFSLGLLSLLYVRRRDAI